MLAEESMESHALQADDKEQLDFLDHIDDWIEYLVKLLDITTEDQTIAKYGRQIKYLIKFRCGANCNISHNKVLMHYYSTSGQAFEGEIHLLGEDMSEERGTGADESQGKLQAQLAELREQASSLVLQESMAIFPKEPLQECYLSDTYAYSQILKALASEDLFFLQGPPGTGKTTAIVEVVLQTLRHKPNARILITSETHIAVDNAIDRLTGCLTEAQLQAVLRYPQFSAAALENEAAYKVQAHARANALWNQALQAAPELTSRLWQRLERGRENEDGTETLPRWMTRNLADKHQIIGVTCNQIDHLFDEDSEMFDLAIVDECSKATMPEWIMALTVSQKCVLVGDHKQLPPTFCQEESEALSVLSEHKERLIRDGVIERIFENFPESKKGSLLKQYRMLPHIGKFISEFFYDGKLKHHRQTGNGRFEEFGWLTYEARNHMVPAQRGGEKKILINKLEVVIIIGRLQHMRQQMLRPKVGDKSPAKLSVAVITPYRDHCKELRQALSRLDLSDCFAIEVDTVDAFQGRQADVVFFSFVRTVGPATFYADDRRLNVAISRAKDCVYLVGDLRYIKSKRIPALQALAKLDVLYTLKV